MYGFWVLFHIIQQLNDNRHKNNWEVCQLYLSTKLIVAVSGCELVIQGCR